MNENVVIELYLILKKYGIFEEFTSYIQNKKGTITR